MQSSNANTLYHHLQRPNKKRRLNAPFLDQDVYQQQQQQQAAVAADNYQDYSDQLRPLQQDEEDALFDNLQKQGTIQSMPKIARLQRKYKLRKLKQEAELPFFDLDAKVATWVQHGNNTMQNIVSESPNKKKAKSNNLTVNTKNLMTPPSTPYSMPTSPYHTMNGKVKMEKMNNGTATTTPSPYGSPYYHHAPIYPTSPRILYPTQQYFPASPTPHHPMMPPMYNPYMAAMQQSKMATNVQPKKPQPFQAPGKGTVPMIPAPMMSANAYTMMGRAAPTPFMGQQTRMFNMNMPRMSTDTMIVTSPAPMKPEPASPPQKISATTTTMTTSNTSTRHKPKEKNRHARNNNDDDDADEENDDDDDDDDVIITDEKQRSAIMFDSFHSAIAGRSDAERYKVIKSNFSGSILKPVAYVECDVQPTKKNLLMEVMQFHYGHEYTRFYSNANIEFCYLRQHHLAQVHPLLHHFVMPQMDVSDFVHTPELAIVVQYKRLVIGFGMITKDGYMPVLFLHPEWQHRELLCTLVALLMHACPSHVISTHVNICKPYNLALIPILQHQVGMVADSYHANYFDKYCKSKDQHALYFLRKQ